MRLSKLFRSLDRAAFRNTVLDGLAEVAVGVFLLLMALAVGTPLTVFVLLVPALIMVPVLRKVQRRYTEPRIGYVKPIADSPKEMMPGIIGYLLLVLSVAIVIFVVRGALQSDSRSIAFEINRWLAAITGFAIAGGFWYSGRRSGLKRFYALSILSPALGVALVLLRGGEGMFGDDDKMAALRMFLVCMGLVCTVSGVSNFLLFLHRHPVAAAEAHHVQP